MRILSTLAIAAAAVVAACHTQQTVSMTTKLLDPGAEPRRVLAYQPAERTAAARFTQTIGEKDAEMTLTLEWTTHADGSARLHVADAGFEQQGKPLPDGAAGVAWRGATAHATIAPVGLRNIVEEGKVKLNPSPQDVLIDGTVRLPAGAIGVGARWQTVETFEHGAFDRRVVTYTLSSVGDDGSVRVHFESDLPAKVRGDAAFSLTDPLATVSAEVEQSFQGSKVESRFTIERN